MKMSGPQVQRSTVSDTIPQETTFVLHSSQRKQKMISKFHSGGHNGFLCIQLHVLFLLLFLYSDCPVMHLSLNVKDERWAINRVGGNTGAMRCVGVR